MKYKIMAVRLENEVAMKPQFSIAETNNEEWTKKIVEALEHNEGDLYGFSYVKI